MSSNVTRPTGPSVVQGAPWWGDYNRAVGNGRVTASEVERWIAPHKDRFDDSGKYGETIRGLLAPNSPIQLTCEAREALQELLKSDEPQHWWPTNDQLKNIYGNIADSMISSGRATKMDSAPQGYRDAPSWDLTPPGLTDFNKTVYLIDGKLYMRQLAMSATGQKTTWYGVGPAPQF